MSGQSTAPNIRQRACYRHLCKPLIRMRASCTHKFEQSTQHTHLTLSSMHPLIDRACSSKFRIFQLAWITKRRNIGSATLKQMCTLKWCVTHAAKPFQTPNLSTHRRARVVVRCHSAPEGSSRPTCLCSTLGLASKTSQCTPHRSWISCTIATVQQCCPRFAM